MKGLFARFAAGSALASLALTQVVAQSNAFEPVTDAMIQDPDPKDWLSWRRTLDSWGYSPLDQIDRESVDRLSLAWYRDLEPGRVLVDHAEEHTIEMILEHGFWAGLTLYPQTKISPQRAADLIEKYGPERICVAGAKRARFCACGSFWPAL